MLRSNLSETHFVSLGRCQPLHPLRPTQRSAIVIFPVSVVSSTWQVDPQVVPHQRKPSPPPQTFLHLQAHRFPRQEPKSDRSRSESTSLLSEVGWVRAGRCVIWHCESGGSVRSHRHRAQSPCGSTPETASVPVRKNPARPFPRNYRSA